MMTEWEPGEIDQFVLDRMDSSPFWIATLSNGKEVYQDDNRYGDKDPAWLRVTDYCRRKNLFVKKLVFQFRCTRKEFLGDNFYFTLGAGANWSAGVTGATDTFYILGQVHGDQLIKSWWKMPEISLFKTEYEPLEEVLNGDFKDALIRKDR
jgi:hypothetical protein